VELLGCFDHVQETALIMINYMAKNTSFGGLAPSMRTMTLVNLAAKEKYEDIPTKRWRELGLGSYNTILKHSILSAKNHILPISGKTDLIID
jgi:hypothetical protein